MAQSVFWINCVNFSVSKQARIKFTVSQTFKKFNSCNKRKVQKENFPAPCIQLNYDWQLQSTLKISIYCTYCVWSPPRTMWWDQALCRVSSPVIAAGGGRSHSGVSLIWNEPIEALLCNQAHLIPVLLSKVAAVCVEVPEKHHILLTYTQTQQHWCYLHRLSNCVILKGF